MVYQRRKATKISLALLLLLYVSIAVSTHLTKQPEIFPFFSWSLFSSVPQPEKTNYGLRLIAVDGKTLQTPLFFEEGEQYFAGANSIMAMTTIRRLARAIEAGNAGQIVEYQTFFEEMFLAEASDVAYEVVRRTYNPVERWRTGRYISVECLRSAEFQRLSQLAEAPAPLYSCN